MSSILLLLPLWFISGQDAATDPPVPELGKLNAYVLKVMRSYPTDGTHRYYWPKKGEWAGNTCDLTYLGKLFAKGDKKKRSFCCGLTFEVFFLAWKEWCQDQKQSFVIGELSTHEKLRAFLKQWFGSDGNRKTHQNALVANGLGVAIEKLEDAEPGDFVQFWRHSGSGHSVIFVEWVRKKDEIVGLKYWSTQGATKGIGYREEMIGGEKGLIRAEIYIARVGKKKREDSGESK